MSRGAVYIIIDFNNPGDYFDDINIKKNYYLNLAIRSAKSIKTYMPDLPITLFTNINHDLLVDTPFDNFMNIPVHIDDMWISKFECLKISPYDQTVHMDADTYVCDQFYEVFDSLERYDLASTMSVSWNTRKMFNVPDSFPELAFGVFWWRKNEVVNEFFDNTIELLKKRKNGCDEPFVRTALYNSDVKFYVLPWEYNCLYTHPVYLFGKVKVMHGHSDNIENDEIILNSKVYEDYPPWKRIATGTELILFKKVKQKLMKVEDVYDYNGLGNGLSRA